MLFGIILILAAVLALIVMYHAMMQEMYADEMKEELQKRFDREIEFRWLNQDIRIQQKFVIVDETRR